MTNSLPRNLPKQKSVGTLGLKLNDPNMVAVATKLTSDPTRPYKKTVPDFHSLIGTSGNTLRAQNDAINILEMHPEIELAGNILVSCIVSPNDLSSSKLVWNCSETVGDSKLTKKLLDYIQNFFEIEYKINDKVSKWIFKALFKNGSYPLCIIPESSLDSIINGPINNPTQFSFEDASSQLKSILANREKKFKDNKITASFENSFNIANFLPKEAKKRPHRENPLKVELTTSMDVLKIGKFNSMKIQHDTYKNVTTGLESEHLTVEHAPENMSRADIASIFYSRKQQRRNREYIRVKTTEQTDRPNIGHPLSMKLPPESVVPIFNPGSPSEHYGYLIILDDNKNPISKQRSNQYFDMLKNEFGADTDQSSSTIAKVHSEHSENNLSDLYNNNMKYDEIYQQFCSTVENNFIDLLRDKMLGKDIEIGSTDNFYKIMLARHLKKENTQVLFIPEQLMTYISYNYNEQGVGISLLEKNKMLTSLKSVVTFANAMTNMHNAVPRMSYEVTFDETDQAPEESLDKVMHALMRGKSNAYPFNQTDPVSIVQSILMASIDISVTNHPEFNDLKVTAEQLNMDRQLVDTEYEKSLDDRLLKGLTMIPELVSSSTDIDFAIEATNRNLMFNKTVKDYQSKTNPFLEDHVLKYSINSGKIMHDMFKIIAEHQLDTSNDMVEKYEEATSTTLKDDSTRDENTSSKKNVTEIFFDFFDMLTVKLPAPEETKVANQLQAFTSYTEAVNQVIDYLMSDEKLNLMLGNDASEYASSIKDITKGYLIKVYMTNNNLFSEVLDLIDVSESSILKDMENSINTGGALEKAVYSTIKAVVEKNKVGNNSEDSSDKTETGFNW